MGVPLFLGLFAGAVLFGRTDVRTRHLDESERAPSEVSETEPTLPPDEVSRWQASVGAVLKARIATLKEPPTGIILSFGIREDGAFQDVQAKSAANQGEIDQKAARDLVDAVAGIKVEPPPDHQRHLFTVPVTFRN